MRQLSLITHTREAIFAVALVCLALSSALLGQEPSPTAAKPAGPTVQLSLIVTDSKNKSLNSVNKSDIRLVEDKVEQTVLSVTPDDRPVDCGLVIDASGSFRRLIDSTIAAATVIIVNRQPNDEMFIERFVSADKIEKLHDFSGEPNALIGALNSIKIEGGQSAVIDAIYVAADYVAKHNLNSDRRKVLVVFTDGEDRRSNYNLEKLLKLLRDKKVQIFVVGLVADLDDVSGPIRISPREKAVKLLNTIADETGGRAFFPKNKTELTDSILQIITDLRGQFRLMYQSSNGEKKGLRKVEVQLNSSNGEKRKAIVPRGYESQQ